MYTLETLLLMTLWWEVPQKHNCVTFRNNANKLLKQAQYCGKDRKYFSSLKDSSLYRNSGKTEVGDPSLIGLLWIQWTITWGPDRFNSNRFR